MMKYFNFYNVAVFCFSIMITIYLFENQKETNRFYIKDLDAEITESAVFADDLNLINTQSKSKELLLSQILIENQRLKGKVRFEFSAAKIPTKASISDKEFVILFGNVAITGKLFNDTNDTICYLSYTCYGNKVNLQYNKDAISINNSIHSCFTSNPTEGFVLPKDSVNFNFSIWNNNGAKTIEMGYDFIAIPKNMDIETVNLVIDKIRDRTNNEKNVLWFSTTIKDK